MSTGTEVQVTQHGNAVSAQTQWPTSWEWPTYVWHYPVTVQQPEQDYANEVLVERGAYDADVTFYRERDGVRVLVKRVTVPLALLDVIGGEHGE